jgi:hypothetical protein
MRLPFGLYHRSVPLTRHDDTVYEWSLVGVFPTREIADGAGHALARAQMERVGFVDDYETREVTLTQARDAWRLFEGDRS